VAKPGSLTSDIVKKGDAKPTPDAKTRAEREDPKGGNRRGIVAEIHDPSLDVVCRTPVRLSVEVGRAQMALKNILQLAQGSVIELDRGPDTPYTIYVNGALFAYGQAMLTEKDKYAVEIESFVKKVQK
jgi:flagellar motor switch protein FliN